MVLDDIEKIIKQDALTPWKLDANTALEYYDGRHDILNSRIYYFDEDGELMEDTYRSNLKITHQFFTELVDQQVQFMLSGDKPVFIAEDQDLQAALNFYFAENFKDALYDLIEGAIIKGREYLSIYRDAAGRLRFDTTDSRSVIEFEADGAPAALIVTPTPGGTKRVELWTAETVSYYVMNKNGRLEAVEEGRAHIRMADGSGRGYGRIPLFRLQNDKENRGLLPRVKSLIDDYDLMACGLSNNLSDADFPLYVVKNPAGNKADREKLVNNIKQQRQVGVKGDGDVQIKTVDIPYEARKTKLELDEKNIYRFGMGLNVNRINDGHTTNVAIKAHYSLLEMKCKKLEIKLRALLAELLALVMPEINGFLHTNYKAEDVTIDLSRKMMVNEKDQAETRKTEAETQAAYISTMLSLDERLPADVIMQKICETLDIQWTDVREYVEGGGVYE